jgi:hypothetical protein
MRARLLILTATLLGTAVVAAADAQAPAPSPTPTPAKRTPAARPPEKGKPVKAGETTPASGLGGHEGKAASPEPKRTFSNEDLPAQPSPVVPPSPGTGRGSVTVLPKTAAPSVPAPSAEPPVPFDLTEPFWRERARAQREAITLAQAAISDIEDHIAALRNDRSPTNVMDPNREQTRQAEITKAQAALESAKAALESARKALTDLEEEARRKSIPPGWLRER